MSSKALAEMSSTWLPQDCCVHPDRQSMVSRLSEGNCGPCILPTMRRRTASRFCQAWIFQLVMPVYKSQELLETCCWFFSFCLHTLSNQFRSFGFV